MENKKKKIYFVINPVSGTSSKVGLPHKIAKALDAHKFDIHIFITGYAGHGAEIASQAVADGVDYVVAVGGDGTVNEVARSLVNSNTVLGIMPMGSGNGLGRDLHLATNPDKALATIVEEHSIEIDYGKANGHIFFCTCGVGFDAEVAENVAGQKSRGTFMYFKTMLETYFQLKPKEYEVICPEGTIKEKAFVVTCANASQYGYNAHIAPHADIQDGKMNIAILKPLSLLDVPRASVQLFARNIDENKKMLEFVTNKATIKRESEGVMHIDGDPILGAAKEINVEIIPKGLKVLVPKNPPKRHPLDPLELLVTVFGAKKKQDIK